MQRILLLAALFLTLTTNAEARNSDFLSGRIHQIAVVHAQDLSPAAEPSFGTLLTGETQTIEVHVSAGSCSLFIAVGDLEVKDLDMAVLLDNQQVGGDDGPDDWPLAHFCSEPEASLSIRLTMFEGAGQFALAQYSSTFQADDLIALQMAYFANRFASGHQPQGEIQRANLNSGQEQDFQLSLLQGRCYTIIATAQPQVTDLDLYLFDPEGNLVDADEMLDNYPVVGVCPRSAGVYTLKATLFRGAGEFGFALFYLNRP